MKKYPAEYLSRLAARYPVFWLVMTTACLMAAVLLSVLALRPETGGGSGFSPAPRAFTQGASGVMPGGTGAPASPDSPGDAAPPQTAAQSGLAIVIDDLGENMQAVHALLELRIPISLAIWPHARFAREAAQAAHDAACAVLVHQPMEALKANSDPGPRPLRTGMARERMESIFRGGLARVPYAEGVNNHMGSRFTSQAEAVRLFCDIAADSDLFVLDSVTHPASLLYEEARAAGIPAARRDIFLDATPGKAAALEQLHKAERLALSGKQLVAIGHPLTETLAALREWNGKRNPALRLLSLRDCLTRP